MPATDLIDQITSQLEIKKKASISQVPSLTAKAWLASQILDTPLMKRSGALLVVASSFDKDKLISNLHFWQQTSDKPLAIHDFAQDKNSLLLNWLNNQQLVAVASEHELLDKLPPPTSFLSACLKITLNDISSPITLTKQLIDLGLQRQTRVFLPGEMAKRGELLDIFPIQGSHPVRVEFIDKRIAKLYYFDLLSQQPSKNIRSLTIAPIKNLTDNLQVTILDYLPKQTLLITPAGLTANITGSDHYHLSWHELKTKDSILAGFMPSPTYQLEPRQLLADCQQKSDWTIYTATANISQLEKTIPHLKSLNNQGYVEGFINKKAKLWLLTDKELTTQPLIPTAAGGPIKNDELKIGDFVVHLDHGVAKFAGLTKQKIDNASKEYFVLHYAEGDKLFVPIDRIDKISKYIGLTRPSLHRLSGTSWTTAVLKIKKETLDTARRLITLYAQRQVIETKPINQTHPLEKELADDFPFPTTTDQNKALADIANDLKKSRPLDRLICGDVGFGKTEIALRTAFKIVLNGGQVALLCPTTILAQQHFDNFQKRLNKFGVNTELLSRFRSQSQQKATVNKLKQGLIDIIIGTHRLLSEDVGFKNLGLIIIDEEQKFGVQHKEWLKSLRALTHVLALSATPIPRTLYFSLTGIRPISLINTPPSGRRPIATHINKYNKTLIKQALEYELARSGQAYYLYNQVESIDIKARDIQKLVPSARLGIAHGQLPPAKLAEVMHKFDTGAIDILICSTIIENGLDLPNVNTLIVEQAPRFGLSQLYQLRGRIGRADRQAYAYFFYSSTKLTGVALKRLQALENAQSLGEGFAIAKRDMELRGIGNILGTKQHGQVKTVGLNLYLNLLEQAVTEIKTGQPSEPVKTITIDLPLTYNIPDEIVTSQQQKFSLYQQLADIKDQKKLEKFVQTKFKPDLPQEFLNLIVILKIKILCRQTNVTAIDTIYPHGGDIKIILYPSQELTPDKLAKLLNDNPAWNYKNNKLKIEKIRLGNPWTKKLMESLTILR